MGSVESKMKDGLSQAPTVHIKKFFSAARKQVTAARSDSRKKSGSRLYVKGVVAGFKGSQAKQYNHTNLIKIQGVHDSEDVKFYLGKRIMYMYRTKTADKEGNRFRVMWGKVCRAHGTSGIVRAKFKNNLPPSALGAPVRVMLFPSRV